MNGWLTAPGAFELAPDADLARVDCGPGEIRLIAAAEGSCEVAFDGSCATIAGDKVLLLRGGAPASLTRSPDLRIAQIALRLGGGIIIHAEPLADRAELVEQLNGSRRHPFDFNIHSKTTFQER